MTKRMLAEKTDNELLQQYLVERNPTILNSLFARHIDMGFRTAMRYMRNTSDAEDILQLAFIQFLKNLHLFRKDATTVRPWLIKMIINISLNQIKEEKRRANRQQQVAAKKVTAFKESESNRESKSDQELLKSKIKTLVDTLPEKYRSPLWLVLYEGLTYPEVANILALPEKTVRTQVSRGLERLKEIVGSLGPVMSVEMISHLMKTTDLDIASESTIHLIDSQKLYQLTASPPAHLTKYTEVFIKPTLVSERFVLWSLLSLLATLGVFFVIYQKEKPNSKEQAPATLAQPFGDINISWSFIKEADRNLPILVGSWEWSSKNMAMKNVQDKPLVISLPIAYQEKPFVLETTFAPQKEIEKIGNLYCFAMFWAKGKYTLANTTYFGSNKESKIVDVTKPVNVKVYFINNCVLTYINGECIRVNQYAEHLKEAKPIIISQGFLHQKISIGTIEVVPEEVRLQLKYKLNKASVSQEKTLISDEMPLN